MATLLKVMLGALVMPAGAWFMDAHAVDGDVVAGAGNLTGGKVGTYTVLLQVLNPQLGAMKLLLECCDEARHMAGDIAMKINTNQYSGNVQDTIRKENVGKGMCSAPGPIESMAKKGNSKCTYMYAFEDKQWRQYQYTAQCIASDVCAVDVVGVTKGLKVTYPVVIQILNRNAGDMQYAGLGPIGSCLEGMNMVNTAGKFTTKKQSFVEVFGHKIPTGTKEVMHFDGMEQLKVKEMFTHCENRSDTGMLYVFKNKFWIGAQHAMNITDFDLEQEKIQRQKDLDDLMNYKIPKKGEPAPVTTKKPEALEVAEQMSEASEKLKSDESSEEVTADLEEMEDQMEQKAVEEEEEKQEEAAEEAAKLKEEREEYKEYEAKQDADKATEVKIPEVKIPEVKIPEVKIPEVKVPETPKVPEVKIPEVKIPEVKIPKAPKTPEVEAPEPPKAPEPPVIPEVEAPEPPKAPEPPVIPEVKAPEPPAPVAPVIPEVVTDDADAEKAEAAKELAEKLSDEAVTTAKKAKKAKKTKTAKKAKKSPKAKKGKKAPKEEEEHPEPEKEVMRRLEETEHIMI